MGKEGWGNKGKMETKSKQIYENKWKNKIRYETIKKKFVCFLFVISCFRGFSPLLFEEMRISCKHVEKNPLVCQWE